MGASSTSFGSASTSTLRPGLGSSRGRPRRSGLPERRSPGRGAVAGGPLAGGAPRPVRVLRSGATLTRGRRVALLATGGSGALASVVGAGRALEECGIVPAVVSLCSGSALFGFPLAAGIPAAEVADFALSLRPDDYVDVDWPTLVKLGPRSGAAASPGSPGDPHRGDLPHPARRRNPRRAGHPRVRSDLEHRGRTASSTSDPERIRTCPSPTRCAWRSRCPCLSNPCRVDGWLLVRRRPRRHLPDQACPRHRRPVRGRTRSELLLPARVRGRGRDRLGTPGGQHPLYREPQRARPARPTGRTRPTEPAPPAEHNRRSPRPPRPLRQRSEDWASTGSSWTRPTGRRLCTPGGAPAVTPCKPKRNGAPTTLSHHPRTEPRTPQPSHTRSAADRLRCVRAALFFRVRRGYGRSALLP